MVARHVGPLGRASHRLVALQCLLSFALIAVLNTWWFAKMALGLARLLEVKQEKEKGKGDENGAGAARSSSSSSSSSSSGRAGQKKKRRAD